MKPLSHICLVVCLLFALVVSTACLPDPAPADPTMVPKPIQPVTARPTTAPVPQPTLVTSRDGVKSATVQIVAEGSFADPKEGLQFEAGAGSGFIIDESGLAVTNNHVVTGAGLLKVYVGGEPEPHNAKVVGVSECSDLALIDIDGDGYPYLEWYSDAVSAGLDVYAAGFPLGDPQFTLTRGIVSKERANGDTSWASIDHILEHDATINGGNSGGPLITTDGQVVGVNYAGDKSADQYFAIARDEALKVIDRLRAGQDVTSLGINGTAMIFDENVSGIWVASVKSGSPADRAGIQPGDILAELEGLPLATDGTMADYCDILRTHNADDTLSVLVLRLATQEILKGQFNGDKLQQVFSFAQELETDMAPTSSDTTYTSYTTITDDSDAIRLEAPSSWTDIDGSALTSDSSVIGAMIVATPDLSKFMESYDVPGVIFVASHQLAARTNEAALLDQMKSDYESCTYNGRTSYKDSLYSGFYDLWGGCGSADSIILHLAVVPESRAFLIYLDIRVVTDADLEALDHILQNFVVVNELP